MLRDIRRQVSIICQAKHSSKNQLQKFPEPGPNIFRKFVTFRIRIENCQETSLGKVRQGWHQFIHLQGLGLVFQCKSLKTHTSTFSFCHPVFKSPLRIHPRLVRVRRRHRERCPLHVQYSKWNLNSNQFQDVSSALRCLAESISMWLESEFSPNLNQSHLLGTGVPGHGLFALHPLLYGQVLWYIPLHSGHQCTCGHQNTWAIHLDAGDGNHCPSGLDTPRSPVKLSSCFELESR